MTGAAGPDVIDASALLALLQDEPGAEAVLLADAVMSSVKCSEVLHKSLEKGASTERHLGLSLADRACLALAIAPRGATSAR